MARYRSPVDEEFREDRTYDVSSNGMFIATDDPVPRSTLLKIECQTADDGEPVVAVARVAWIRRESSGERPSGMGVKFVRVDAHSSQALERVLASEAPAGEDSGPATSSEAAGSAGAQPATTDAAPMEPASPDAPGATAAGGIAKAEPASTAATTQPATATGPVSASSDSDDEPVPPPPTSRTGLIAAVAVLAALALWALLPARGSEGAEQPESAQPALAAPAAPEARDPAPAAAPASVEGSAPAQDPAQDAPAQAELGVPAGAQQGPEPVAAENDTAASAVQGNAEAQAAAAQGNAGEQAAAAEGNAEEQAAAAEGNAEASANPPAASGTERPQASASTRGAAPTDVDPGAAEPSAPVVADEYRLRVVTTPPGAQVKLGDATRRAPFSVTLSAAELEQPIEVYAELDGYRATRGRVTLDSFEMVKGVARDTLYLKLRLRAGEASDTPE